ncbi:NAD(+)/NADH kinase [Candidatus Peregrinibacteria bacterium]|nr:NAD(+)/NADH kinase [Candidatus Peregrinibacteria bacterium]MBI3816665.1 NAD(+)/NADH kinase [Candidatus Peregrinibacteria bacterium]
MPPFRRIGVTIKSDLTERDSVVEKILDILQNCHVEVLLDAERCLHVAQHKHVSSFTEEKDLDLLVVIGGDGTIFRTVRELKDFSIPLLTINRGAVGFLAETDVDEAAEVLPRLLSGEGILDERNVLAVCAKRGKKILFEGCVLNEAVLSQGTIARLVDLRTRVNDEELATFRADGLILATPTGSTAYSLAAGGPIVHPRFSSMILTPINPHSFSQKPIVVPGDSHIDVEVLTKENKFRDVEVSLTLDGQSYVRLQRHDVIHAHLNDKTVKFLRRKQDTFFSTLRSKLRWGEGVDA